MIRFRDYIKEDISPFANVQGEKTSIESQEVRDALNGLLAGVTIGSFLTPYIGLERVSKVLATAAIFLPKYTFMEGDSGSAVFNINQYGEKTGMNDKGELVTAPPSDYKVYFEYRMNPIGLYNIFCEIVDQDDLDEIQADIDDEMEDSEEVKETGSKDYPGADKDSG